MAPTTTPHPPIYHPIAILLGFLFTTAVAATQRGFSLELIPPFSDRSPFYPGNLTRSQQLQWLAQSCQTHERSTTLGPNTTALRTPLLERNRNYMVKLDIGTGHRTSQLLLLDTGSSHTWIQCKPCNPCFPQPDPLFIGSKSSTYHALPSNDARCVRPYWPGPGGQCAYRIDYADRTYTSGVVSTETFSFQSDNNGRSQRFPGLIFGCGHSNNFPHKTGDWTGALGMGSSPVSILMQLSDETRGRFSYCLVRPFMGAPTFLRFGDDYVMRRHFQRTEISIFPDMGRYYLTLNDVSFGDHRPGLPVQFFEHQQDRTGGFIIDSGSVMSYMIKPAYDEMSTHLEGYFSARHLRRVTRCGRSNLRLCYELPASADVLPPMTLHFAGADLRIRRESTFQTNEEKHCFCWAMFPSDDYTLLGAYQQADIRFVFDIGARMLWFDHEDCAADGHHN